MVERGGLREKARMLAEMLARGHSLEEAAKRLSISPARARLLLTLLDDVGAGVSCSLACNTCPLSGACRIRRVRVIKV